MHDDDVNDVGLETILVLQTIDRRRFLTSLILRVRQTYLHVAMSHPTTGTVGRWVRIR
jgi:hypothetical protein